MLPSQLQQKRALFCWKDMYYNDTAQASLYLGAATICQAST